MPVPVAAREAPIPLAAQNARLSDYLHHLGGIAALLEEEVTTRPFERRSPTYVLDSAMELLDLIALAEHDGIDLAAILFDKQMTRALVQLRLVMDNPRITSENRALAAEIVLAVARRQLDLANGNQRHQIRALHNAAAALTLMERHYAVADLVPPDVDPATLTDTITRALALARFESEGVGSALAMLDAPVPLAGRDEAFTREGAIIDFLIAARETGLARERAETLLARLGIDGPLGPQLATRDRVIKALILSGDTDAAIAEVKQINSDLIGREAELEGLEEPELPHWLVIAETIGKYREGRFPKDLLIEYLGILENKPDEEVRATALVLKALLEGDGTIPDAAWPKPQVLIGRNYTTAVSLKTTERMADRNFRAFKGGRPLTFAQAAIDARINHATRIVTTANVRQTEVPLAIDLQLLRGDYAFRAEIAGKLGLTRAKVDDGTDRCPLVVNVYRTRRPKGELFRDVRCTGGDPAYTIEDTTTGVDIGFAQLAAIAGGEPDLAASLLEDRMASQIDSTVAVMVPMRGFNDTIETLRKYKHDAALLYLEASLQAEQRGSAPYDRKALFAAAQWGLRSAASDSLLRAAALTKAQQFDPAIGELVREFESIREIEGRPEDSPFPPFYCHRSAFSLDGDWDSQDYREKYLAFEAAEDAKAQACRAKLADHKLKDQALKEAEPERQARMRELGAIISEKYPAYWTAIDPKPVDLAEVQQSLAADEVLILIVPGYRSTTILAVDRTRVQRGSSTLTMFDVKRATERLLWDAGGMVSVPMAVEERWANEGGEGLPFARALAFRLHHELFGQVQDLMEGKRRMLVASGGDLQRLPLGLLVTQRPQGADGDPEALRNTAWLADRFAIVQLPSIASLQLLTKERTSVARPTRFVGFGDPVLDGRAQTRGGERRGLALRNANREAQQEDLSPAEQARLLAALPGTGRELTSIAARIGTERSRVFLGPQATEAAVRAFDFTNASILSFATHGVMPGELGGLEEAALVLTPEPGAKGDEGLLTSSEIAALFLPIDWVLLSACNTAVDSDEGISSLMDSFFFAGARSIVASHWPVADDAAATLSSEAVSLWAGNPSLTRAEALQQAMRAVRLDTSHDRVDADGQASTWAHPSAWAPFSIYGDLDRRVPPR
jgi:CHAT domain-containing protein